MNYTQTKHEVLKKYFGYDSFRKGQELLVDSMLAGQDVLGIMPTGAGKSLCYQIPALMLEGITIVISPLISLMMDQVRSLNEAGVHAAYINSSLSENQIRRALYNASMGQYKIIYVAPERLETYEFVEFARAVKISLLAIDEAHCISQWGQDFRPSYLKIMQFIKVLKERPVICAFTATATERVREDILCSLGLNNPSVLVTGFDRENLFFGVEKPKKKMEYVVNYLKVHEKDSGIIYCATRKNVEQLYEQLGSMGFSVAKYHAGMSAQERWQSQENFSFDVTPVMIATNAFGMGIDKSNVRYVLHYNMPQNLESYYQEAGRAGRDGGASECVLLYSPQDVMINRFLIESKENISDLSWNELQFIREQDEDRLRIMNNYCMTTGCLRSYILKYFGEQANHRCENCSSCLKEYEELDISKEAGIIINCVREMGQRYGINVVAGTLAGAGRAKLREYGVTRFSAFGAMSQMTELYIKDMISWLVLEEYLSVTNDKYALIKLTKKSVQFINEPFAIIMKKPKEAQKEESAKASKSSKSTRLSDTLNSEGLELFDKLRELRRELAREEGVPPYIIFTDKTLTDMCVKLPFTKAEMLGVNGVGENKYEKYGKAFIEVLTAFTGGIKKKLYFGEKVQENMGSQDIDGNHDVKRECAEDVSGSSGRKGPKVDFYLTRQQADNFAYKESYYVAELAEQLSILRDASTTKKIFGKDIYSRVEELGYVLSYKEDDIYYKKVSDEGHDAGIFVGTRISRKGTEYQDFFYNEKAQRMIVEWYVKE